ncbi:MAG: VIT domain-containing protein [Armatimonas sp.]
MDDTEFEKQLKEAYAPPPAPESVHERVRGIEAMMPLPQRRPVVRRVALAMVGAMLFAVGLSVVRLQGGKTGSAAAALPEPGQLLLKGKAGKAQGTCPLTHTEVSARIDGVVSRVTVTQTFVAPKDQSGPLEAVYTFPLPENAAVSAMEMRIGADRIVRATLKRRAAAHLVYELAKASGKTAALLDQERPNVFTQSVANLLPGQPVQVTLTYTALVPFKNGQYEFVFPMTVGPRYESNGGSETGKSGPRLPFLPVANSIPMRNGHDIGLKVSIDGGLPLRSLNSAMHAVRIDAPDASHAIVALAPQDTVPNRDFILRYKLSGQEVQEGLLCNADGTGGGQFLLMLQPPAQPAPEAIAPREVVFVIDQTGSQSGEPLEVSKKVIRACLKRLKPTDTFQLLGFNTEVYPCFPKAVPATPENLAKAEAYLDPLVGDGGTDILKSMEAALTLPDEPGRLRLVAYFTDGFVDNEDAIFKTIAKDRGRVRIFPFGVGSSVNRWLIEGMAREGRGVSEIVPLDSRADELATRFAERMADPVLTDIQLDGRSLSEVYPKQLPDVFAAAPLVVTGRYSKAGPGILRLSGNLGGKPWHRDVSVNFPARTTGTEAIGTLWAREKIAELSFEQARGEEREEAITQTALAYNLMSEYTSFVAVEERIVTQGGKSRRVAVTSELPEGMAPENATTFATPEPGSVVLALLGLVGLGIFSRRRLAESAPVTIEKLS